jgi:hypothetical protein
MSYLLSRNSIHDRNRDRNRIAQYRIYGTVAVGRCGALLSLICPASRGRAWPRARLRCRVRSLCKQHQKDILPYKIHARCLAWQTLRRLSVNVHQSYILPSKSLSCSTLKSDTSHFDFCRQPLPQEPHHTWENMFMPSSDSDSMHNEPRPPSFRRGCLCEITNHEIMAGKSWRDSLPTCTQESARLSSEQRTA